MSQGEGLVKLCELQAELTIHFMELSLYLKEQLTNYSYSEVCRHFLQNEQNEPSLQASNC